MVAALRAGVIGGGGWLGGAIVGAMLDSKLTSPDALTLSYRRTTPTRFSGVQWVRDNQELVDRSEVIIVSIRPADWPFLRVNARGKLVISVMAGITLDALAEQLDTNRVIRALPNALAEVRKSYTPWIGSAHLTDRDRSVTRDIFDACGTTDEMTSEADIDYFTGLSGSDTAFPALLAAAMIRDAVAHGIDPEIARRAVTTVLIGAGRLLEVNGESPTATVEAFVGYGGTTAAAFEAMRAANFERAISEGLSAAHRKAVGMGE